MRSMLAIARGALGRDETPDKEPNPRFFIVTDEMKRPIIPAADIVAAMSEAVKENTAMTEPATNITDRFREGLETHRLAVEKTIADVREAQATANTEHAEQLQRLRDEIASREEAHAELTAGNDAHIADAERTLAGIAKALQATDPPGIAAAAPAIGENGAEAVVPVKPGAKLKAVPAAPAGGDQS